MIHDCGEPPVVVLVGENDDVHVQTVYDRVQRSGAECLIVDERTMRFRISYAHHSPTVECATGAGWTTLATAHSIWWWRKETTLAFSRADDFVGDFVLREHRELLEALELLLPKAHWPLRPSAVRTASLKVHQLALARELGFRVPLSLVTNDASALGDLVAAQPHAFPDDTLIYKPLSWYVAAPSQFLFAHLVHVEQVLDDPASVTVAPCQFQEYITKDYEVRATVVGAQCFAVRINSQTHQETAIDYRRALHLNSYETTTLPGDIVARLHEFLRRCHLEYGAFDLIVTPDGGVVFLEMNPLGQWLWLEHSTGLDISGAIADLLTGGHCDTSEPRQSR